MLMLAALGAAVAFAPSWDSYVLRTASGASESVTAGNAFAYPAPMIAGEVAVMVALVAVVVTAALWRPIRYGAALLAGAIIPMVAQAISAFLQVGETTSPTLFGISPAQASAAGLTISNGLTPVFWIFCAFVVAMIASCAWMLMTPHSAVPEPPRPSQPPAGQARPGLARVRAGGPGVQGTRRAGARGRGAGQRRDAGPGTAPAHSGPAADTGNAAT